MQSFSRGWSFLKQAWEMAFKDKDLLKPSIYALVAGMIVSVIGIIPLGDWLFYFRHRGHRRIYHVHHGRHFGLCAVRGDVCFFRR